jgi:hypothetical protein
MENPIVKGQSNSIFYFIFIMHTKIKNYKLEFANNEAVAPFVDECIEECAHCHRGIRVIRDD